MPTYILGRLLENISALASIYIKAPVKVHTFLTCDLESISSTDWAETFSAAIFGRNFDKIALVNFAFKILKKYS
jgi:hypothetical protein